MTDDGPDQRLTIGEAARRLGTSRMRVREALAAGVLGGYRNNQGQWLVDTDTLPASLDGLKAASLPPDRLLELLFDEVEELQQTIEERDATIAQLTALMERQGNALERAVSLAEERGDERSRDQVRALSETSGRAMRLLEDAMGRLGDNADAIRQLSQLVERGVMTSEQFEAQLQRHQADLEEKQAVIEQQGRMIDRLFSLSDKVLGLAGLSSRRDGGLLRRFFNRSGEGK